MIVDILATLQPPTLQPCNPRTPHQHPHHHQHPHNSHHPAAIIPTMPAKFKFSPSPSLSMWINPPYIAPYIAPFDPSRYPLAYPYILYFFFFFCAIKGTERKKNKVIYLYINMWTHRTTERSTAPQHGKNTAPRPLSASPLQILSQTHNKPQYVTLINQQHPGQ